MTDKKYERTTIYLHNKEEIKDWIRMLRIVDSDVKRIEQRKIYQEIFNLAMDHQDELKQRLKDD